MKSGDIWSVALYLLEFSTLTHSQEAETLELTRYLHTNYLVATQEYQPLQ
jgi:hypothetical protein